MRTNSTAIAAVALARDDADAMICGLEGQYEYHLREVRHVIGKVAGLRDFAALSLLITQRGTLFLTDTYVSAEPDADEIVETAILAAAAIRRFGIEPKVALVSHSNFGSKDSASAAKMRLAAERLAVRAPELESDGEMHGDAALSQTLRDRVLAGSRIMGEANLLVFPNLDAANITLNVLKALNDGLHVGPILLGSARPAHILTPTVTSRGIVNMTAFAVVEARQTANGTESE